MKTLLTLLLFALPAVSMAADPLSKRVAPFLDAETLGVAAIDVANVDLALLVSVLDVNGEMPVEQLKDELPKFKTELVKLGVREIVLSYGAGDFPNLPVVAVAGEGIDAAKVMALLKGLLPSYELKHKSLHGFECYGTAGAMDAFETRKSVPRPDLAAALDESEGGVIRLAFALTADAKRIHEQLLPMLPPEIGGGDIKALTRGFQWLSFQINRGATVPAKWVVQASDEAAAGELRRFWTKANESLEKMVAEENPEVVKPLREAATRFATTMNGSKIVVTGELADVKKAFTKAVPPVPVGRARSQNNLKQIQLAMWNYHDVNGSFPTNVLDKEGKPLLSWRVQLLPYLEQDHIYKQFKLDQPWDSDHNKALIEKMPAILKSPMQDPKLTDRTTYLGPKGPGTMWDIPKRKDRQGKFQGLSVADITDGTSNTIMVVECDDLHAVIWSKPDDLAVDAKDPFKGLVRPGADGFNVAMGDGSVRYLRKTLDATNLWYAFTRGGGEVQNLDDRPKKIKPSELRK
jgi:Protein of unknown function (DUF1559)